MPIAAHGAEPAEWLIREDLAAAPANVIEKGSVTQAREGWRFFSGEWKFGDGSLKGAQREDERRGAQLVCVMPCNDAIVEFEFQLETCRMVQFRWQDKVPEHICRVLINPSGFSVQKDDHDHAGPDGDVPLGKQQFDVARERWMSARVEIVGEVIRATIDGRAVSGRHPLLAARKHFFEFIVSGGSARFRKVRARPEPGPMTTVPVDGGATGLATGQSNQERKVP